MQGRTPVQALLHELKEYRLDSAESKEIQRYYYKATKDNQDRLHTLFFAHPKSIEILKGNYDIILLDCTYKTNKFRMPLLHITGVTCLNTSFEIAYCFLPNERQPAYEVAMQALYNLFKTINKSPRCFLTDKEGALKAALRIYWPNTPQRLCLWHLFNNVKTHATQVWDICHFETQAEKEEAQKTRDAFLSKIRKIQSTLTPREFWQEWDNLREIYDAQPRLLKYLEDEWLPCREEWANPWCKSIPDFGNSVTSRVEGLHTKLKSYLQVSTGHLYDVLKHIDVLITNECQQFIAELSRCHVRHHYSHKRVAELQDLFYEISPCALELLAQQIKLAKDSTRNQPCTSSFSHKFGIPCAHNLSPRLHTTEGVLKIQPCEIDGHWHFKRAQSALPTRSQEPRIQDPAPIRPRGRPAGSTTREFSSSTRRELSQFEVVDLTQTQPQLGLNNVTPMPTQTHGDQGRAGAVQIRGQGRQQGRRGQGHQRGQGRQRGNTSDVPSSFLNEFQL